MNKFICILFLLIPMTLFGQNWDMTCLEITNVSVTNQYNKQLDFGFELFYPDDFVDSVGFEILLSLKTTDFKDDVTTNPIKLYAKANTLTNKFHSIKLPYRTIELNEGNHDVFIVFEVFHTIKHKQIIAVFDYSFYQPKRYQVDIDISPGKISKLNGKNKWDHHPSNKSLPDPIWWLYIDRSYLRKSPEPNLNTYTAPSTSFKFPVLQIEGIAVKLYDQDHFGKDDFIGTYQLPHPNEQMDTTLIGLNAENVSGFNIRMKKSLLLVAE